MWPGWFLNIFNYVILNFLSPDLLLILNCPHSHIYWPSSCSANPYSYPATHGPPSYSAPFLPFYEKSLTHSYSRLTHYGTSTITFSLCDSHLTYSHTLFFQNSSVKPRLVSLLFLSPHSPSPCLVSPGAVRKDKTVQEERNQISNCRCDNGIKRKEKYMKINGGEILNKLIRCC